MELKNVSFGNITITGYASDYILQTIDQTKNFYESTLLNKWTVLFQNAKYILDIGANIGNHTVFWAKTLTVEKIVSFEPYPPNYELLCKNIVDNHLSCVQTFDKAVGEKTGVVKVKKFSPENYGGTSFQYVKEDECIDTSIPVCSLDEFFPQLQLPQIDFVKIDTEGFELSVLKGMQQIINCYKPTIWVEVSKTTVAEVYQMLCAQEYCLMDMSGANMLFIWGEQTENSKISWKDLLTENLSLRSRLDSCIKNYEESKTLVLLRDREIEAKNASIARLQKETDKALADMTQARNEALHQAIKQVFSEMDGRFKAFKLEKTLEVEQITKNVQEQCAQLRIEIAAKAEQCAQLEKENAKLNTVLQHKDLILQSEITAIHSSWSYRIGRLITLIPRKIRDRIRPCKESKVC